MNIETVGVVGLGNMGLGMAATLARKGFKVIGYDISDIAYCFPFFGPFNTIAFETIRRFNCRCLDRLGLSETTRTLQSVFLFYPLLTSFLC